MSKVISIKTGVGNGGLQITYSYAVLDCGHTAYGITQTGDEHACLSCEHQERGVGILRDAITQKLVHHTRAKSWCGVNQIQVYRLDATSPSGFFLIVTVEETPETSAMLRGTIAPLSPTERV